MVQILIIHGPNLNLLGEREPAVYGTDTLEILNNTIMAHGKAVGVVCETFQSNHEGAIIDKIQEARKTVDGIIINAGAYTHTSYAIRDALGAVKLPIIEVHLSNIYAREEFRHHSLIAPVCLGQIAGLGQKGYLLAIDAILDHIKR